MADPMDVLAPNSLGDELENTGLAEIAQNRGLGVAQVPRANPLLPREETPGEPRGEDQHDPLNKLRVAKARQFGRPKEKVGF
jgi:hypothetical protein